MFDNRDEERQKRGYKAEAANAINRRARAKICQKARFKRPNGVSKEV